MSVRTKTPPTDVQCTLAFLGPAAQAAAAREALQALGFRALEGDAPSEKTARPAHRTSKAGRFLRGPLDVLPPLRHAQGVEGETKTSLRVPWREAFLPLDDAERPGRMLRAARTKEALSQMQLAARTGIPQRHLSEMEQGKRTIGKARARQLAAALQVDYRVLL